MSTFASAAVAVYTAMLAKQTRALAKSTVETARLSRDAVAPSVQLESPELEFDRTTTDHDSRLRLTAGIRNYGNGPALGVNLSVALANSNISSDRHIGSLGAQENRNSLVYSLNIANADMNCVIAPFPAATISVNYSAISGDLHTTKYELEAAETKGDHVLKATFD